METLIDKEDKITFEKQNLLISLKWYIIYSSFINTVEILLQSTMDYLTIIINLLALISFGYDIFLIIFRTNTIGTKVFYMKFFYIKYIILCIIYIIDFIITQSYYNISYIAYDEYENFFIAVYDVNTIAKIGIFAYISYFIKMKLL